MIEKKWFPVIYMFIVTCFFSSVVIGFSMFSKEQVEANAQIAFERAVLQVLPGLYDPNLSNIQLHQNFVENVTQGSPSTGDALTLRQNGKIIAYALPISGQGFWSPIQAVIGIEENKKTITGLAIYQQNETPGLGAEIAKPSFTKQFQGRQISQTAKHINIKRAGSELEKHDVHAVTGATQTSVRLEKIINDAITKWQNVIK
jgi:Na+-transporting NADH:ubiquinone oxidoreductase subunit C